MVSCSDDEDSLWLQFNYCLELFRAAPPQCASVARGPRATDEGRRSCRNRRALALVLFPRSSRTGMPSAVFCCCPLPVLLAGGAAQSKSKRLSRHARGCRYSHPEPLSTSDLQMNNPKPLPCFFNSSGCSSCLSRQSFLIDHG